ncbi:MAG TPA: AAA family ATPase [Aliidongia sp.]|nr:AAA family ATPase [Aliidongia sp.]
MTFIEDLTPQPPSTGSDTIANILNMLRRRRYLILAFVVLCTGLTALVAAHLKPLYRVELNLLIDPHNAQVNDVQTLATQSMFVDSSLIHNQMAILWSDDLARQVVTSLDLENTPDFDPNASRYFKPLVPDNMLDRALIAIRAALKSGAAEILGAGQTAPSSETPEARLNAAITRYLGMLSVINDGRSYVVTVRVAASDPALAVKIANAHTRAYLDRQIVQKASSVRDANSSVTAELDTLATKLKASEEALRSYRDNSSMIGPDSPAVISQQITDLTGKLITTRSQVTDKQARLRALQALLEDPAGRDVGTLVTSPAYDRLRAKEQDLLQQQSEFRATFGDAYPKVAEIQLQIATTEGQLKAEVGRMVKSAAAEISATKSQEDQILAALQATKVGVQHQESAASNLHFLEADVEANKTVYTAFLTRVRQLSAQETLQQPDGRIIGDVIMPIYPYFPNKPLIVAGGLVGSTGLAVMLALVMGFASRGFDTLAQVEKACNAPGLGIVPLVRRNARKVGLHNQITRLPRSHYSERVRMIRNSLALTVDPQRRGQVVLLTSSLPMEGKTSCAVSLAMSVAAAGRKTLLIDADLRKPSVGRLLGADTNRPGFGDLIEAKATMEEVVQVHESSGLHYIPADRASVTAQDRANFDLSAEFFEAARSRYDYIFIDSPPLIAVSDALWLAHAADTTLFLVRWQSTPRSAVRAAIQKLRDTGTLVTGVLLTFVDIEKSGSLTPSDFDYYLSSVSNYYAHR